MRITLPSRQAVTAAAPQAPVVVDLEAQDPGRAHRVRAIAAVASRVAGIVTIVPFVPPQVRVGAGAITGISTALDVAFRPRGERAVAAAATAQTDRAIFSDPAAMAADVTSALTAGALAAGQAIAGVRGSRLVGRTVRIVIATGVVVAGAAAGYQFVVRPVLERRARGRREAESSRALVVVDEGTVEVVAVPPFDDAEGPAADAADAQPAMDAPAADTPDGAPA